MSIGRLTRFNRVAVGCWPSLADGVSGMRSPDGEKSITDYFKNIILRVNEVEPDVNR
jgi:hypothetical protein